MIYAMWYYGLVGFVILAGGYIKHRRELDMVDSDD